MQAHAIPDGIVDDTGHGEWLHGAPVRVAGDGR